MENKEFLNVCYKFFNRFITVSELIDKLSNTGVFEINTLVDEIKKISNEIPNKVDEYAIKKREKDKFFIDKLDEIPKDDEELTVLYNVLDNFKNSYNKEIDSMERWLKVFEYITQNDYFNTCFNSLSNYELLEFIAQNIQAPNPPKLTQDKFECLVKVGSEHDEREWLWRLAFNYVDKEIKIDSIIRYFIKVKDGYYLVETISAMGEYLNIDKIIDKIDDRELINYLKKNKNVICNHITDKQYNRLMNKLN